VAAAISLNGEWIMWNPISLSFMSSPICVIDGIDAKLLLVIAVLMACGAAGVGGGGGGGVFLPPVGPTPVARLFVMLLVVLP
jgi:Na+/serine symporter